ncbi:MAG TPA: LacI family DNA-binding transcriptional regulator [Opitutaceae bacterium]|nr:LacI family DNA-binding transcriptional regulator [Opitutaceae bacterium]
MKPNSSEFPSRRVTLRSIAHAANVSTMTVSLALRGSLEVSAAERARIQALAEKMGYRPDPLLAHLMEHLRSQRTLKIHRNLAVLQTLDATFVKRLIEGARTRAERLGYSLDQVDLGIYEGKRNALTRMLLARGVAGVLLAPTADPASYSELLDWNNFPAVAMTYSVIEPRVHRVVTHHFDNAVRTFVFLRQAGLDRIGLAMTGDMEFRTNHSYSGAYFRIGSSREVRVFPILYLDQSSRRDIRRWFERHRPDAIVVANASQVRQLVLPALGPRVCAKVAFAALDYESGEGIAGMDQRFEIIGSHAIDALVAQIHRNEKGLPANPTIGMVEGHWSIERGLYPFGKTKDE